MTAVLLGRFNLDHAVQHRPRSFDVLAAGTAPARPNEVLASRRFGQLVRTLQSPIRLRPARRTPRAARRRRPHHQPARPCRDPRVPVRSDEPGFPAVGCRGAGRGVGAAGRDDPVARTRAAGAEGPPPGAVEAGTARPGGARRAGGRAHGGAGRPGVERSWGWRGERPVEAPAPVRTIALAEGEPTRHGHEPADQWEQGDREVSGRVRSACPGPAHVRPVFLGLHEDDGRVDDDPTVPGRLDLGPGRSGVVGIFMTRGTRPRDGGALTCPMRGPGSDEIRGGIRPESVSTTYTCEVT